MASKPPLPPPLELAAMVPDPEEIPYHWLARSDRIWSRVMPYYHQLSEDDLWQALLWAAKADD